MIPVIPTEADRACFNGNGTSIAEYIWNWLCGLF